MNILNVFRDLGIYGLAMWFIQLLISKSADRKFESYKTELDHKTREFQSTLDSKIELYRAELNLQNYKSTKIYERQLNVIIDLHKILVKLHREMQVMTAFLKPIINDAKQEETERIKRAGEAYDAFMLFQQDNVILLPKATADKVESIRNDYFDSFMDYTFGHRFGVKDKFTFEQSKEAGEKVSGKIKLALDQIVEDFRGLIGLEIPKTK